MNHGFSIPRVSNNTGKYRYIITSTAATSASSLFVRQASAANGITQSIHCGDWSFMNRMNVIVITAIHRSNSSGRLSFNHGNASTGANCAA